MAGCRNCGRKRAAPLRHAVPPERRGMKKPNQMMTADEFNELYPEGTSFRYYPVRGDVEYLDTKTRSPAWNLGDGTPVVLIKGKTGGVCIEHLKALP